ncbi:AAA domain-containing protein [Parafrankia discariae]|uniref:AAA domain-containing protein n=1 Tax=Parafrankia discariae TaxID=365528 RepID=UPI0003820235|nr:AAA domain-containing protein [Parafrankia discariae]
MSALDLVKSRSLRLLDYLAALATDLRGAPRRRLAEYSPVPVLPRDVPVHAAVRLGPGETRASWLEVGKVAVPEPPRVPRELYPYIGGVAVLPAAPPALPVDLPERAAGRGEDPAAVTRAHARWVHDSWQPWAAPARAAHAARHLYERLFDLRLRHAADTAGLQLVWGHSVLSWQPAAAAGAEQVIVEHPLLLTPVRVEVDQDTGLIRVSPDGSTTLETDPVRGLEAPELRSLPGLRDRLRTDPPDVWDPAELAELHDQLVAPLGLDAAVLPGPDLPSPGRDARVVDTWALFLRPRPATGARFYSELREAMAELDFLPEAVAAVVAPDALVTEALAEARHGPAGAGDPDPIGRGADDGWAATGARLLMPLPTNDDQERVATQLATSRGVTVQGPPGTGKSHTIANLVCHLVAHGRRVLVTAQDEQALVVLREKIPAELRHLSVAVLGSSQADIEELRASVVEIQAAVADVDLRTETRQVAGLAAELDAARSRTRALELELVELLRGEEREFELPHGRARAADVSEWLARNERELGRIPDRLDPAAPVPLRPDELADLVTLARRIPPDEAAAAGRSLPDPTALPGATALSALFHRLAELGSGVAEAERAGLTATAVDRLGEAGLAQLRAEALAGAAALRAVEEPWLVTLRDQCGSSPRLADFWRGQAAELAAAVTALHALHGRVFGHTAQVPGGDPRDQLRLLGELRERLAGGRGLPRFGGRELREFAERLIVDGYPARTVADLDIAAAMIEARVRSAAALTRQADIAVQLGAPPLAEGPGGGEAGVFVTLPALDAVSAAMAAALDWDRGPGPALAGRLRAVFPALPDRPTAADLLGHAELLELAGARIAQRAAEAELAGLAELLRIGRHAPEASVLWSELAEALRSRDPDAWARVLEESARLCALRPAVRRRAELADRLAAVAPRWAGLILADLGDASTCGDPGQLTGLWRWRQAESWLDDLHSGADVPALQRRLDDATESVHRLVLEVARRSARLALANNLGPEQRQALTGWVQALSRIGKGTGRFAGRWRAEARGHMTAAMGAVPIWIMPIHRVMESFDPRVNDPFDVVIVDESSQCDVLSLGVLSLGRKAVVVGDDQQTSPSAVGIPRDRVFALIEDHLPDVAHRSLLDVEASLYDTATRVFPRTVVLKEHFRCLPEIIGFSNRFYDHQILPLRETPEVTVGPPLRPVRVAGGGRAPGRFGDANAVEAAAVVDQVVDCCADPAYDGMTFGVVTLLGAGQPRLIEHSLVEKLGEEEYVRRRIRVGDPYQFQGDERDVIFVSVVADDNRSAATRRRDMQRVNVAASRARDQLWVFHTVAPETLRDDDVRRQLIEYMYAARAPGEVARLQDLCESEFERAVLREILARGFRVRPQHPVGRFRIDLVIEGESARIAVECDGDRYHGPEQWEADLRRQRVLERLGWTFWRIRGSEFYRHPARTLDGLWRRLDQLGIRPAPVSPTPPDPAPRVPWAPIAPTVPTARIAPDTQPTAGTPPTANIPPAANIPPTAGTPVGPTGPGVPPGVPYQRPEPPGETTGTGPVRAEPTSHTGLRSVGAGSAVPAGYRHAGWVRPEEAAAVLDALALARDVPVGATGGRARIVALDPCDLLLAHPELAASSGSGGGEVEPQPAAAVLLRPRPGPNAGGRRITWLSEREARAVLRAADRRRDQPVDVSDRTGTGPGAPAGPGGSTRTGLVQYFPEESEVARRYGSVTRLLRAEPANG